MSIAECRECVHYSYDHDLEAVLIFCGKNHFNGSEDAPANVQIQRDAHQRNTTPCEMKDFVPRVSAEDLLCDKIMNNVTSLLEKFEERLLKKIGERITKLGDTKNQRS